MKITTVQGTPQEIAEYEHLTGVSGQSPSGPDAAPTPAESDETEPAETAALGGSAPLAAADHVALMKYVYGRAGKDPERTVQTERFLMRLLEAEKVVVAFGRSSKTFDGLADYLMIRDAGPQRYGAVAYLRPANGGMTLRLSPGHLEALDLDADNDRIQPRNVASTDPYKINCPLRDEHSTELALTLVRLALDIVRSE